ncbi:hypothetical protein GCM10008929_11790 [Alkalibacterium psychrotolerans]
MSGGRRAFFVVTFLVEGIENNKENGYNKVSEKIIKEDSGQSEQK